MLELAVEPAVHNRGIGGRLYTVVIDALRGLDPISMDIWSREDMPCRLAFLEHRGFREDQRIWSSELDLAAFDPTPFRGYAEAVQSNGLVVRSLAELRASGALDERELYDLWVEIHEDIPLAPSQEWTRRTFEDWRPRHLEHPSMFADAYLIALDGDGTRYIGTSHLYHAPEKDRLRTGLTGVRRAYRGRGIAFGLKVRALEMVKQRGYRFVDTENASSNAGMLSINDRLGFLRRPAWIHYAADWTTATATPARLQGAS
jgi:GNAT superfamily N-acetyltransferase